MHKFCPRTGNGCESDPNNPSLQPYPSRDTFVYCGNFIPKCNNRLFSPQAKSAKIVIFEIAKRQIVLGVRVGGGHLKNNLRKNIFYTFFSSQL